MLLFWLASGVALATVGVNRLFASGVVNYQVLYEAVSGGWLRAAEHQWDLRILLVRLAETAFLFLICRGRLRGPGPAVILLAAGFSAGTAMVLFTWCRGLWGIFCFVLSGFPHDLFYLAAWGLLILRYTLYANVRRGRFWSVTVLLFLAGILTELWINPVFLSFL